MEHDWKMLDSTQDDSHYLPYAPWKGNNFFFFSFSFQVYVPDATLGSCISEDLTYCEVRYFGRGKVKNILFASQKG